jgi:alpha-tubulin suppressor-like RCC1 family protein
MAKIIKTFEHKLGKCSETTKIICVFADKYNDKNVIFVTNDDKVYGFGYNRKKFLGLGYVENVTKPTLIIVHHKRAKKFCLSLSLSHPSQG